MTINRREFLLVTGGALLTAPATALRVQPVPPISERPLNLLLITVDDMNATMPGWMGNKLNLTPRMDAFAATCHRFVNNRASTPICQPSRQAMLTGLVPHRSGGFGFNPVRPGTASLVTILRSRGYFLAAINKIIHMEPQSVFPWDMKKGGSGKDPDTLGRQMTECLDSARQAGKPFFINCNITDPHRPFYGVNGGGKPQRGRAAEPMGKIPMELGAADVTVPSFLEDLPDVRTEFAQYCNSVQRLDISFDKTLDALRASGEYDRTVILFVSDHGMPFPFSKATVFNSGLWCPALLRYPAMGAPRQFQEYTCGTDIMPTLLDTLDVPTPDGIDGRSWMPLIKGQQQPGRDVVIGHVSTLSSGIYYPQRVAQSAEFALCFAPWSDGKTQFRAESMSGLTYPALADAARTNPKIESRLKQYITGVPLAFYDMKVDPDQRHNVIDEPRYKPEVDRFKRVLREHMEKTKDPELGNFLLVASGKSADIAPTAARIKQEQAELRAGSPRAKAEQ